MKTLNIFNYLSLFDTIISMSKEQNQGKANIPQKVDVELAIDGDLHTKWKSAGTEYRTVREIITVNEALVAQSDPADPVDRKNISKN